MYEFFEAEKDAVTDAGEKKYTVTRMCAWLGVSTSGFYDWCSRPGSATARRRAYLAVLIEKIFTDSDETPQGSAARSRPTRSTVEAAEPATHPAAGIP